jgi:hypothetical protein
MVGTCHKPPERGTYYCPDHTWTDCTVEDFRAHRALFDRWVFTRFFPGLAIAMAVVLALVTALR